MSAPIGAQISVTSVIQAGSTILVNGSGFSSLTVINFFNKQGGGAPNLGGLNPAGAPRIPLSIVDAKTFTFGKPAGAVAGPSYVQALNPPFVPFTSSGNGPGGAFNLGPSATPTPVKTPVATATKTPTNAHRPQPKLRPRPQPKLRPKPQRKPPPGSRRGRPHRPQPPRILRSRPRPRRGQPRRPDPHPSCCPGALPSISPRPWSLDALKARRRL